MSSPATEARAQLLTPTFVRVTSAGLAYFVAVAVMVPTIPVHVQDELGGGDVAVGVSVGVFFLVAAVLRPFVGALGDRRGSRTLVVGGASFTGGMLLLYPLADSVAAFVALRAVSGLGEAAFFIGASAVISDLAPPDRRGEALSYWSVAIYGGFGLGPVLGELVRPHGHTWVWLTSSALCALAAAIGSGAPDGVRNTQRFELRSVLHRAGVLPGVVVGLGLLGYSGFLAFVPLYAKELGMDGVGGLLLAYALFILAVRLKFPWLVDRLGPIRAATIALATTGTGLAVIASFSSVAGLYAGTLVMAAGMSMVFPALMSLAVGWAPVDQRRAVIGTFTGFFDLAQGLGAVLLGVLVPFFGYRGAFLASALAAAAALVVLRVATAGEVGPGPTPSVAEM